MARPSKGVAADDGAVTLNKLTDNTTGTAGDTLDDTTAGQKDDVATLNAKLNEVIDILKDYGMAE